METIADIRSRIKMRKMFVPLLLVMTPLIILSILTLFQFQRTVQKSTIASMQNSVDERMAILRNSLDSAKREGYGIAQNPLAINLANQSNQLSSKSGNSSVSMPDKVTMDTQVELSMYLLTLVNDSQIYENMFFLDKSGNFITDAFDGAYSKVNFKDMDFFKSALRGNRNIQDITFSPMTKRPIVIVGNPMFDRNKQLTGISGIVLQFDVLSTRLIRQTENARFNYGIADKDGSVIAYTGKELKIREKLPEISESLSRLFSQMKKNHTGYGFYTANGKKLASAYAILPEKSWYIFTTIETDDYNKSIYIIAAVVALILSVCFFIALLVIARTKQLKESNLQYERTLNELKQTQHQLIVSEKMAALGGLVAGMAHEINTPVGIGVTAVTHLKESSDRVYESFKGNSLKKSDLERFIETSNEATELIFSNLKRASNLIQSFKLIAVDQSTDEKRLFNLGEYIEEIIRSLDPVLRKTKLKVIVDCTNDIALYSYPGVISQIISNLVINSIKHAYEEDDEGTLTISASLNGADVHMKFSDDGKGIPEGMMDKIFDPFFTTKRNNGGTGLGLNIVYNLVVNDLKGNLGCNSTPGKGTEFVIDFPYEKP